jgi:hypothetical protein
LHPPLGAELGQGWPACFVSAAPARGSLAPVGGGDSAGGFLRGGDYPLLARLDSLAAWYDWMRAALAEAAPVPAETVTVGLAAPATTP